MNLSRNIVAGEKENFRKLFCDIVLNQNNDLKQNMKHALPLKEKKTIYMWKLVANIKFTNFVFVAKIIIWVRSEEDKKT